MSTTAINWAKTPKFGLNAIRTSGHRNWADLERFFLGICEIMDGKSHEASFLMDTMAKRFQRTRRTIVNWLRQLERLNVLKRQNHQRVAGEALHFVQNTYEIFFEEKNIFPTRNDQQECDLQAEPQAHLSHGVYTDIKNPKETSSQDSNWRGSFERMGLTDFLSEDEEKTLCEAEGWAKDLGFGLNRYTLEVFLRLPKGKIRSMARYTDKAISNLCREEAEKGKDAFQKVRSMVDAIKGRKEAQETLKRASEQSQKIESHLGVTIYLHDGQLTAYSPLGGIADWDGTRWVDSNNPDRRITGQPIAKHGMNIPTPRMAMEALAQLEATA